MASVKSGNREERSGGLYSGEAADVHIYSRRISLACVDAAWSDVAVNPDRLRLREGLCGWLGE